MATRCGLGSRVIGRQRIDPNAWGGSFPRHAPQHATRCRDSPHQEGRDHDRPGTCPEPDGDQPLGGRGGPRCRRRTRGPVVSASSTPAALRRAAAPAVGGVRVHECDVRPPRGREGDQRRASRRSREEAWWCPEPDLNRHARSGAARFKLAVSAFHHPGRPWAPLRGSEPIGGLRAADGGMGRSCLILLAPEGASGLGTRCQHMPTALRLTPRHGCGMTEFHRPNKGAPPVLGTSGSGCAVLLRYDAGLRGPTLVAPRNRSSG